MTSDQPDPPSSVTESLEKELDNFITLQQQLQYTNTLTIHQLAHSISSSHKTPTTDKTAETSDKTPTAVDYRTRRVFKRKHPNAQPQVLHHPRPARLFSLHPLYTNTKEFLKFTLPFFPHYTYYQTTNNDQRNYVDEYSLFLTLSSTS